MQAETLPVQELSENFQRDGYVVVRGFLEREVVAQAREAMAELVDREAARLLTAGKSDSLYTEEPFEMRMARLYANCPEAAPKMFRKELHLPGLFPLFFHPRLLDLVETMLGDEIRLYPNYTARPKLPDHVATVVLWHQDGGYTGGEVETLRMVNLWTPLVPVSVENGCMQFVPGTHRLGPVPHEMQEHYLEIRPDILAPYAGQEIAIEMKPGDIVLFHNLLFHRGLPNHAKTVRWSLDWRYQDADQPTLRDEIGHIARSRRHPESAVPSAAEWASLSFR